MLDLSDTIVIKTDQLNSEDLVFGPRIIKVRDVVKKTVNGITVFWIYFDGDNNKPFKPCKAMRSLLIAPVSWGENGEKFIGKSMKIYLDPDVYFGTEKVGGIRISHLSDIKSNFKMTLKEKRGKNKEYHVQVLEQKPEITLEEAKAKCLDALKGQEIPEEKIEALKNAESKEALTTIYKEITKK